MSSFQFFQFYLIVLKHALNNFYVPQTMLGYDNTKINRYGSSFQAYNMQ